MKKKNVNYFIAISMIFISNRLDWNVKTITAYGYLRLIQKSNCKKKVEIF